MYWHHRIIHRHYTWPEFEEDSYAIHEVFFNDANEPEMCTEEPSAPHGESIEELRVDVERFMKAFDRPMLEWERFEKHE